MFKIINGCNQILQRAKDGYEYINIDFDKKYLIENLENLGYTVYIVNATFKHEKDYIVVIWENPKTSTLENFITAEKAHELATTIPEDLSEIFKKVDQLILEAKQKGHTSTSLPYYDNYFFRHYSFEIMKEYTKRGYIASHDLISFQKTLFTLL